jgi:hypothetical protein
MKKVCFAPCDVRESFQRLTLCYALGQNPEKEAALAALPVRPLTDADKALLPPYIAEGDVTCSFRDGNILWFGTNEGLWRLDPDNAEPLDRVQCYRACAYLADNAVRAVDGDGDDGVWALTEKGLSHIALRKMSVEQKAVLMSEINRKYVSRRGMLSGARWDEKCKTFRGEESDNDGLWTSVYAIGDLARYAVLRDGGTASAEEVRRARELATLWTEACLLLAYIPAWKGSVPGFVRYNNPGDNKSSRLYLKKGGDPDVGVPANGPTGFVEFTPAPVHPEDWAETDAVPEVVFHNVEGYIARSYHVDSPDDPPDIEGNVMMRKVRTPEGKLISVRVPSVTWKGDDIPPLHAVDSSMPIPDRLRRLYTDEGFRDEDIIYRTDTSNDELVGHYTLWLVAYDVLGPEDPELAEIIRVIAARHAKHLEENNLCHVDCGGQPTSWARMDRAYYMNAGSYGITDGPLGTAILLACFKVAAHVTGDSHWEELYRHLALDEPYRYGDLLAEFYERYARIARAEAGRELTETEEFHAVVQNMNYSDLRMGALVYYTLGQLETDPVLLEKIRAGAAAWWKFLKYSRDVEWCLVWQLLYPEEEQRDAFGRTCAEMVAWQTGRFPMNAREIMIDNRTRPGVTADGENLWYDAATPCALAYDERGGFGNNAFESVGGYRPDRSRSLSLPYNLIMPYWMGRYHGMLRETGRPGDVSLEDVETLIFHGLK